MHGGATASAREAGKRRVAEQKATRAAQAKATSTLAHEGLKPISDPLEELGKLATSSREFMLALGERVNALKTIDHHDLKDGIQARVEIELYERAMDRTARLLDKLVQHGYTERQIQIAETEAMLVAGVVKRTIAALGLTAEQQKLAQVTLAEEFRKMAPVSLQNNQALEQVIN